MSLDEKNQVTVASKALDNVILILLVNLIVFSHVSTVSPCNPKIKKSNAKKLLGSNYPLNPSINIQKLNRIIK